MSATVRLLIAEDSEDDAALVQRLLKRGDFTLHAERVDTAAALKAALARQSWDAVISDYSMPGFTGLDALKIVRSRDPDVPFILISGTVGEEIAVGAMKAGASDFVIKQNLARLPQVLARELHEAGMRAAHRQAQQALIESEERHRAMFEQAAVGIVHSTLEGGIQSANAKFAEISGYAHAELMQLGFRDLTHPDDLENSIRGRAAMLAGPGPPYARELRLACKGGSHVWVHVTTSLVRTAGGEPAYFISVMSDISERKRAEQDLQRFRMAMDVTTDSIYLTDPASMRFLYLNEAACSRLGYPREQLLRLGPLDVLALSREELERDYAETIVAGERGWRCERPYIRSDGSQGWTDLQRRALPTGEGTLIVSVGRDITELRRQQERIVRLSRVRAVTSRIGSLIVRVRGREELFREACRIAVEAGEFKAAWLGVVDREAGRVVPIAWRGVDEGYVLHMPLALAVPEDGPQGLIAPAVRDRIPMVSDDMSRDVRVVLANEALVRGFRSLVILPLVIDGESAGVLALYSGETGIFDEDELTLLRELAGDIAFALDHIEKARRLDYLAYYDSLTGLANRTLFHERVAQYVHAARNTQGKLALVIADVERFRIVNDSLGRQAGDELLRRIAERLGHALDPSDIGRIGSDHFAIVLTDIKGKSEIARRIDRVWRDCFAQSFNVEGMQLRMSAKAGIALFPNDGEGAEMLFSHAEAALQVAKQTGERHVFHTRRLTAGASEQLTLENRLRQALENEEFVLHYQPKVDLATRRIVGTEALIRWQSPEEGLVPPGRFIPLLERTGLILDVGAWALRRAALDYELWLQQGIKPPRIAVNVSSIQLRQRDFVEVVGAAASQGAGPPGIDLEITESLMMEDVESNIQKLKAVRELGMEIAIDDFGTGYSSLAYLAKLPVSSLKIDRSFIITMLKEADTMSLVQTIISLAHSLRLTVIAEGVEEEEQAKMLRLLRCDQMQGYLFSRPIPVQELTKLLRTTP